MRLDVSGLRASFERAKLQCLQAGPDCDRAIPAAPRGRRALVVLFVPRSSTAASWVQLGHWSGARELTPGVITTTRWMFWEALRVGTDFSTMPCQIKTKGNPQLCLNVDFSSLITGIVTPGKRFILEWIKDFIIFFSYLKHFRDCLVF